MPTDQALSGVSVLVTRPAGRAAALCALLEQLGATAIHYPVLRIRLVDDPAPLRQALARADFAVFVSVNAVEALRMEPRAVPQLGVETRIAAVGSATAAALETLGFAVEFQPDDRIGSEGLLGSMRSVSLHNREVALFGAAHGRPLLADTLSDRGGRVKSVIAYHREPNRDLEPGDLIRFLSARRRVAVVTSVEGVDALIGGFAVNAPMDKPMDVLDALYASDLAVLSDRVARACRDRGFIARITVTEGIADQSVVDAVVKMMS